MKVKIHYAGRVFYAYPQKLKLPTGSEFLMVSNRQIYGIGHNRKNSGDFPTAEKLNGYTPWTRTMCGGLTCYKL